MKVVTTEENILEALDAAYNAGWQARDSWGNKVAAVEVRKPPDQMFEANLKLINAAGQAILANSQGIEAIAHLTDNIGWKR